MAALSEFERDLLRERTRSGIAAAKDRGKTFGRKAGNRPKSDRLWLKGIGPDRGGEVLSFYCQRAQFKQEYCFRYRSATPRTNLILGSANVGVTPIKSVNKNRLGFNS